ncbi:class I SAM-dependent methyltransferase [uncultured Tateyamaria sp.]|uniref:class I SAM-dependent methyltransferase n=1 Tax=uncultured Tateyamaria sp. TaxID=455651 RepID=UPI00263079A0|nr:class I SAM-dependent methyltransferase [uncultured Tateyamaria sp.]
MTGRGSKNETVPGAQLDASKMPGHWLLARVGKRVLRPGGLSMTHSLLDSLKINGSDNVVEFAPGLAATAHQIITMKPSSYIGIERDKNAVQFTARQLEGTDIAKVIQGTASNCNLGDGEASVVVGEAMLSMQTQWQKELIAHEAFRLLGPGGRYGIHELSITPDQIPIEIKQEIEAALSDAINVGARPLAESDWRKLLEAAGFEVEIVQHAPMHLLQPMRLIQDEGLLGALRIVKNLLFDRTARQRVLQMHRIFKKYETHLSAIMIVAKKPG